MQIEIALIITALLPTVAAWRAWASKDRHPLKGGRKALFVTGLVGVSGALALYVVFDIYTYRIGGFGTNFPGMLRWARPGHWMSLASLCLVLTGRGTSRSFALASALVILILWVIPVWGM